MPTKDTKAGCRARTQHDAVLPTIRRFQILNAFAHCLHISRLCFVSAAQCAITGNLDVQVSLHTARTPDAAFFCPLFHACRLPLPSCRLLSSLTLLLSPPLLLSSFTSRCHLLWQHRQWQARSGQRRGLLPAVAVQQAAGQPHAHQAEPPVAAQRVPHRPLDGAELHLTFASSLRLLSFFKYSSLRLSQFAGGISIPRHAACCPPASSLLWPFHVTHYSLLVTRYLLLAPRLPLSDTPHRINNLCKGKKVAKGMPF